MSSIFFTAYSPISSSLSPPACPADLTNVRAFLYPTSVTPVTQKGSDTRASILDRAVDVASVEGLEGLTIGRLAAELRMSKSGLFAHFGSKQELQLATVAAAAERFRARVIDPALELADGAPRLRAMAERYLDQLRDYSGGCFFA